MSLRPDKRAISFFGDLHPSFAGNVVKAMGSAKQGYPVVTRTLEKVEHKGPTALELIARLNDELRPVVEDVIRLTPNIVEVLVRAPIAARAFKPGQFYRLQNFESLATKCASTTMAMEALALTGASVNHEKGLLSTIVLEMGGSSDLCTLLKKGEPVSLMGPTGAPTRNRRQGNRHPGRRRTRQRRAVLDRPDLPHPGLTRRLLCRLQEADRSIQGRGNRKSRRRRHLVLGRSPRLHPQPRSGSLVRRQHRPVHGRLRPAATWARSPSPWKKPIASS